MGIKKEERECFPEKEPTTNKEAFNHDIDKE
jgi:hypothetical protein